MVVVLVVDEVGPKGKEQLGADVVVLIVIVVPKEIVEKITS